MLPQLDQIQQAARDHTLPALLADLQAQPNAAAALLAAILKVVAPIVRADSAQLVPQLLARIPDPADVALAPLIAELHAWQAPIWLQPRSRQLEYRPSALKQSILIPDQAWVTASVVINESGHMLALTVSNMLLKQSLTGAEPPQMVLTIIYRHLALARRGRQRQLVSLGNDKMLFLWDTDSLNLLGQAQITYGNSDPKMAVSHDGSLVAIGDFGSGVVMLYSLDDLRPGQPANDQPGEPLKPVKILPAGPTSSFSGLTFSADDAFILTATFGGSVSVWDWRRERLHATWQEPHDQAVIHMAALPNRQQAVLAFSDGTLGLWDIATQTMLSRLKVYDKDRYDSVSIRFVLSSDGRTLASSSGEGDTRIWRIDTDHIQPLHDHVLKSHWVRALDDRGDWLVTTGPGQRWCLWDTAQIGMHPLSFQLLAGVITAGWTAWASTQQPTQLWVQAAQQAAASKLGGDQPPIQSLAASADGRWLAVGDQTNRVSLWDMQRRSVVASMLSADVPYDLAISDDAHTLVCVGEQTAVIWDPQTASRRAEFDLYEYATAATVSGSGATVAVAIKDGIIHIWHAANPDLSTTIEFFEDNLTCLLITPDDDWLIGGGSQGSVYCWALDGRADESPVWHRPLHRSILTALSVSADQNWLLVGSGDGSIILANLREDLEPVVFSLDAGVAGLAFVESGPLFRVLDTEGQIHEFVIARS